MKSPDFGYIRPQTLDEALQVLASDEDAVPIAGGQSLLAGLALRLSEPSVVVDIGRLEELKGVSLDDGTVRVGALTRHVDLLRSPLVARHLPLLKQALPNVSHAAVRNRGTIGGSLANSDPAAELPACAFALDATIVLASGKGIRRVSARSFFKGLFDTDKAPGEIIVRVDFPAAEAGQRFCFLELSRRQGDFALMALAAALHLHEGKVTRADLIYFGASQPPIRSLGAERALVGRSPPFDDDWVNNALACELDLTDAPGLRSDTKLKLAAALTRRTLSRLADECDAGLSLSLDASIQHLSAQGAQRP